MIEFMSRSCTGSGAFCLVGLVAAIAWCQASVAPGSFCRPAQRQIAPHPIPANIMKTRGVFAEELRPGKKGTLLLSGLRLRDNQLSRDTASDCFDLGAADALPFQHASRRNSLEWISSKPPLLNTTTTSRSFNRGTSLSTIASASRS